MPYVGMHDRGSPQYGAIPINLATKRLCARFQDHHFN